MACAAPVTHRSAVLSRRLFEQGAEEQESAAHAELVELLALKVRGAPSHAAAPAMSEHACLKPVLMQSPRHTCMLRSWHEGGTAWR
jgi:hypothetical protein